MYHQYHMTCCHACTEATLAVLCDRIDVNYCADNNKAK